MCICVFTISALARFLAEFPRGKKKLQNPNMCKKKKKEVIVIPEELVEVLINTLVSSSVDGMALQEYFRRMQ